MKVVATIQARMGSSRLPGKVLFEAGGKPFLLRQVERIRRAKLIDHIIVATSLESGDDEIVRLCEENEIDVFRGSENDVLDRVSQSLLPTETGFMLNSWVIHHISTPKLSTKS